MVAVFVFSCPVGRDQPLASSDPLYHSATGIALATILLMQIGNLLGRRFSCRSGLDLEVFRNRLKFLGIAIQLVFSWAVLYPPISQVLGTGPVDYHVYFLACFGIPLIFCLDYFKKNNCLPNQKAPSSPDIYSVSFFKL